MNLTAKLLGPNTGLATLMAELFEHLPDVSGGCEGVGARYWDRALIDPARDILGRSGKGFRALLLERCWRVAGGNDDGPPEILPLLIELLHVGSLVIDDIEDDSPMRRGEPALHRRYGVPIALNTGNWLYFVPMALLPRAPLGDDLRLSIYQDVSLAMLRCHQGQALDLSITIDGVPQREAPTLVARATQLKTGSLMELASVIGARSAGAPATTVERFARFGRELGIGLQMLDDWSGIANPSRIDKGVEDIRLGRLTWPWAWLAANSDEVAYASFMNQRRSMRDDEEIRLLIGLLRRRLAPIARQIVRGHLMDSIDDLQTAVDEAADLRPLTDDIQRLERAFG